MLSMEEATLSIRLLNLLTAKSPDNERGTHVDVVRYFLLKNTNVKEITGRVNRSLSAAVTRDRGFELLSELLEVLPVEVVNENAVQWIKIALGQRPKGELKPLRLSVIGRLIEFCSGLPDFKKTVVGEYLAEIIEACLKTDNNVLPLHALTCLNTCLLRFSNSCIPFKNNIEQCLSNCLEYQGEDVTFIKAAAVAFHYMNQIGGAGTDGIVHQNNWTQQFENLCSLIKEALAQLSADDEHARKMSPKKLRNCMIFMETMLQKSYPVPKVIPLEAALEVINKAMDHHECISNSLLMQAENSSILAKLQVNVLYLFRTLVACAQQRLIPFSLTINKMLMNYLRRIHSCDCFKTSSVYIKAAYHVISFWIKTSRNAFHHSFHEKLIRYILGNISPIEQKLTLQLTNNNHSSKRNTPTITKITSATCDSKEVLGIQKIRQKSCLYALETLKDALTFIYLKISTKLTKELYTTLTKLLINIQGGKVADPYTNKNCQLLLYEAAVSLFEQPYFSVPPPLHPVICLLNVAQNSKDTAISAACQNGLNKLELLCQPVCPTLFVGGKDKPSEDSDDEPTICTKESKKIHILSDIVIKPTSIRESEVVYEDVTVEKNICEETVETISNEDDRINSVDSIEEEVTIELETRNDVISDENREESVEERDSCSSTEGDNVCVVIDDDSAEETMEQNGYGESILQNGQKQDDVIVITDEPVTKKIKLNSDDDSDEKMLDSFVNIVNEY